MTAIYLLQVIPSDFRSHGVNAGIDIHPGPGLVLLYGMNGLGKTAFFDAIEWTLTNKVDHITPNVRNNASKNPLTRRGTNNNSHTVTLNFCPDGNSDALQRIIRTGQGCELPSGHSTLASLLKNTE
jgi:exonuclease SbcC